MAVGRISGPLLKENLLRNGVNLAFETNLLYLDVNNSRVGIRTASPAYELDVNGTTRSTNLEVTTQADIATFTVVNNSISSSNTNIYIEPTGANSVVYQASMLVGSQLSISGTTIATLGGSTDLEISTSGSGQVNINSNVTVNGNLHATGNITADGNITLGDQTTDIVTFTGEIASDIIPSQNNQFNLGSNSLKWATIYSNAATIGTVNATNLTVDDFKTSDLDVSVNSISTQSIDTNINLVTSGNGGVIIGNLKIVNNSITNTSSGGITEFAETGTGYVKFAGTNGIVIPVGTVGARPTSLYTEQGMIRYNTELNLVEMWTGVAWFSVAGSSAGVTSDVATDIGIATTIIFG
jgi:hypothetical protein